MDISWWPQYGAIVWLMLGIAFAVAEGLTVQLVSIWYAVGAAVTAAVAAFVHPSLTVQFWTFLVVSTALLVCTRPLAKKMQSAKKENTNADGVIGMGGVVLQAIDNDQSAGRVKANGLDWSARSSNGEAIEAGAKIKVLAIEGVKLIVERQ